MFQETHSDLPSLLMHTNPLPMVGWREAVLYKMFSEFSTWATNRPWEDEGVILWNETRVEPRKMRARYAVFPRISPHSVGHNVKQRPLSSLNFLKRRNRGIHISIATLITTFQASSTVESANKSRFFSVEVTSRYVVVTLCFQCSVKCVTWSLRTCL